MLVVAIDIGGTFTDLLGFDSKAGKFVQAKSLTTPAQLVQGIIDCLRKSGIEASAIDELIHGSTIAINTLIERKGAKTGLIVTRGTRDVYIIGRGNRPEAYNLLFHRHRPLVPRRSTREVDERVLASGEVHEPLRRASVEEACRALKEEGVEAVAVCPLGAITPSPAGLAMPHGQAWWPDFPYRALYRLYDAFLPMGYYTYHSTTPSGAYWDTRRNIRLLREATDDPEVPIHLIGGAASYSSAAEGRAFARAANRKGVIGASMYDQATMGPEDWNAVRAIRFRKAQLP